MIVQRSVATAAAPLCPSDWHWRHQRWPAPGRTWGRRVAQEAERKHALSRHISRAGRVLQLQAVASCTTTTDTPTTSVDVLKEHQALNYPREALRGQHWSAPSRRTENVHIQHSLPVLRMPLMYRLPRTISARRVDGLSRSAPVVGGQEGRDGRRRLNEQELPVVVGNARRQSAAEARRIPPTLSFTPRGSGFARQHVTCVGGRVFGAVGPRRKDHTDTTLPKGKRRG